MQKLNLFVATLSLASPVFAGNVPPPSWSQGTTPVPVDSPLALVGMSVALALVAVRVIRNNKK